MSATQKQKKPVPAGRFVKVGVSVPTPLYERMLAKINRVRTVRPEHCVSDFVRDALREATK